MLFPRHKVQVVFALPKWPTLHSKMLMARHLKFILNPFIFCWKEVKWRPTTGSVFFIRHCCQSITGWVYITVWCISGDCLNSISSAHQTVRSIPIVASIADWKKMSYTYLQKVSFHLPHKCERRQRNTKISGQIKYLVCYFYIQDAIKWLKMQKDGHVKLNLNWSYFKR